MRIDILSKEYPPEVYGGAGVHVAELVSVLREQLDVRVHCFGGPRDENGVQNHAVPEALEGANAALQTLGVDVSMVPGIEGADLVHSHTWYANFAGFLAQQLYGIPHVVSAHSLEPLRPWKAEQLGGGYRVSSFAEKLAFEHADRVIAVSGGMRNDILRAYPNIDPERVEVIHNGIDLEGWRPSAETNVLERFGIDPEKRSVVFVGRITRQKGLPYFLQACRRLDPDVQLILCAGAPDTKEIAAEVEGLVAELAQTRQGVFWISEMLPRDELRQILSHATTFACPSIYEPLGIVNLEAMACGIPVVGTATGGIPEVIDDGTTGILVPIEQVTDGSGTPLDPEKFIGDLADALSRMVSDVGAAREMGQASRKRVEDHFAWQAIGDKTRGLYERVINVAPAGAQA